MDISHILLTKCQATYITGWAAAAGMHDEMAVAMVAAAVIEPHKGRQWGGLRKTLEFTGFWGALRYSHAQNFGPRYEILFRAEPVLDAYPWLIQLV